MLWKLRIIKDPYSDKSDDKARSEDHLQLGLQLQHSDNFAHS